MTLHLPDAQTTATNKETLRVENFAGIQNAEFDLSRMNVFIGPQASGKSVCAKLLFYFKDIINRLNYGLDVEDAKAQIRARHKDVFLKYFPSHSWGKGIFEVEYSFGELWIKVERKGIESSVVNVSYSKYYDSLVKSGREFLDKIERTDADRRLLFAWHNENRIIGPKLEVDIGKTLTNNVCFVPAGRSFFSTLQGSIFTLIASEIDIDPFLTEFGRLYERIRKAQVSSLTPVVEIEREIKKRVARLICGTYQRINNNDYIQTDDGRQVALGNSSSGQQEALPLALLLVNLVFAQFAGAVESTLFVEEPEAHLYPSAQREIVHLLAAVTDLTSDSASSQYVITTHSPYILSALNNLMYGEQIARERPDKRVQISEILGEATLIAPENVRAYAFGDGKVQSIIDENTGLVKATMLDEVSNELAKEFNALLDIAFEEQAA